ncbi:MAG TPA: hypothetical protein VHU83_10665 [Bryobacteraceae bacterium]|jgi:hypothetical protein|nr:hypothetical protein [Bryobacteraceae bacterium]
MRIGYSWLRKTGYGFSKQLMIIVGLIALPITMRLEKVAKAETLPSGQSAKPAPTPGPVERLDARIVCLRTFFAKLRCPVAYLSQDFVEAADDNQLDWRLLPSISVVESGGGKAARNNNIFGWNNGNQLFPTLRAGINQVAFKLGKSSLYRDRDSASKLRIYNPDENYVHTVMDVMNRISPVVNLEPVRRIVQRRNEFLYAAE